MNSLEARAEITLSKEEAQGLRELSDLSAADREKLELRLQIGSVVKTALVMEISILAQPTAQDPDQVRIALRLLCY